MGFTTKMTSYYLVQTALEGQSRRKYQCTNIKHLKEKINYNPFEIKSLSPHKNKLKTKKIVIDSNSPCYWRNK